MAKRITSSAPGFDEPEDADFDDVSGIVGDKEDDEAAITAEFDADPNKTDWIVKIYRVPPNGGKNIWLFDCRPSDLPVMQRIRDEFGSGNYIARVYLNNRLKRQIKYSIEAPRQSVASPSSMSEPMAAALREQTRLLELLIARRPQSMPLGDIAALIGAVSPIITALITRPAGTTSLQDMLGLLATAKELVSDGGSEPDSLLGLGARILGNPAIVEALTKQASPKHAQVIAPAPAALAPPRPPTPEEVQQAQVRQLQQMLAYLVGKAQNNRDPLFYADWVEEEISPQYLAMLKMPGAFDYLSQLHPGVAQHRTWFESLLFALQNPANEEDEGDDSEAESAPNVSPPSPSALSADALAHRFGGGPGYAAADVALDEMG